MIIDSLRILATALLFIAMLIYKIPLQNMFKNCFLQIYIAVFCLIILVFVDNITGFIITLAILIIYFRVYSKEIKEKTKEYYENENKEDEKINQDTNKKPNNMCSGNKCSLEYPERKNNNGINGVNGVNSINSVNSVNGINSVNDDNSIKNNIIITQGLQPYITPQHLVAVQTNILDNNIYSNEISDINVLPDEYKSIPVYKSQGLNTDNYHLRGFDNYNKEYGTLDFKNLFDN